MVRFDGISSEFGRAKVCILLRRTPVVELNYSWRDQTWHVAQAFQKRTIGYSLLLDSARDHDIAAISGQRTNESREKLALESVASPFA